MTLYKGAWTDSTQVDPAKLNTLKELIAGPDYKDNMQKIIRTIYEFAFMTYAGEYPSHTDYRILSSTSKMWQNDYHLSDLPRGPIKNNSMRKLASKTLMEILPPEIEEMVSPTLITMIGLIKSTD